MCVRSKAVSKKTQNPPKKSVVAETLQSLSQQASLWRDRIDQIEAGQPMNRTEWMTDFGGFLALNQNLRDAISSEDSSARWTTRRELEALVERLDGMAAVRTRYLELAHALSSGTVVHHRERTRRERLELRDAAVAELMEISAHANPPELPGPAADAWLQWACSLEDEVNDPSLVMLQKNFPRVDDFVRQLDFKTWQAGIPAAITGAPAAEAPAAPPIAAAIAQPVAAPEVPAVAKPVEEKPEPAPALKLDDRFIELPISPGGAHEAEPVVEPHVIAASTEDFFASATTLIPAASHATEPQEEALPVSFASTAFDWNPASAATPEPAIAAPAAAAMSAVESPSAVAVATESPEEALKAHRPKAKGQISFFPEEEVECFSLYLEKSKRESKEERKVRALFAISHWLNPIDQNPVSHPSCGIRAQVDYSGATDLVPSSPTEASKAIGSHSKLLMFTGGADLLRWSLTQPSNGHFDALATVRRLTLDHIRAWFHDIYKIELAEPQLNDIYRLTSGIPLLVGEMHKLIVHDADAPPSWIGFELWTTVLTNFGNRLPALAHELTHGSSTIRLTEREIEILKMMVIASDDFATPETIVAGLTTEWSDYRHPEFQPLSPADAGSVAVLERLGMLPTRDGAASSSPIQSLVPLQHDDALRQVVRYL